MIDTSVSDSPNADRVDRRSACSAIEQVSMNAKCLGKG
jgi:hypothetical protein